MQSFFSLKRKSQESANAEHKEHKKARISKMKELAAVYVKEKQSNDNEYYYFNSFFRKNKLIYTWLD